MYLGDGVYVGHDGYQYWLYTHNGLEVTNRIAIDVSILSLLNDYVKQPKEAGGHENIF